MQGDVCGASGQIQAVDGLDKVAVDIENLNAASARRGAGKFLAYQKQLVDGIKLHVTAAIHLAGGIVQRNAEAGLGGQIVEFQAEIDLRGGTGNAIRRIHSDSVDKTES